MSSSSSETFRLEAFADAVFAIAITLLVIEIRLPPHEEVLRLGGVAVALAHLWPSYVGYAISFIVIGIMWANHHNLMKLVDVVSARHASRLRSCGAEPVDRRRAGGALHASQSRSTRGDQT